MLIDANDIPRDSTRHFDVCVLGAGPAGISLAMELIGSGLQVCLLESGGFEADQQTQDLYKGTINQDNRTTHSPLHSDRFRLFGGSTAYWGGGCLPYDAIDFEHRSFVPHSGWPIAFDSLAPHYRRACEYCEIGEYVFDERILGGNGPGLWTLIS